MAIIDKNLVFVDGPVLANGTSRVVGLTAFAMPGRMEAIPFRVSVTEDYDPAQVAEITVTLQQAASHNAPDSGDTAWKDVPGASLLVAALGLKAGCRLPWRFVPHGVTMPFMRLRFEIKTQAGQTAKQGKFFAALLREEDMPYVPAIQVK